jgi:hypothetical protein
MSLLDGEWLTTPHDNNSWSSLAISESEFLYDWLFIANLFVLASRPESSSFATERLRP